ncbi:bifunctional peptidase and arginyl-hydroxylase JMJD5-like [Haliotis rubra]|uniref:bifunctional peptidase and arginyl-hydroxylase JMJD5-like n=1 Tax=Haliotis rubra TaxID=36100 RepID=UPI001EE5D3A8|nr:bifunctional peptidase and arginyl-hydroxylase JMJD5-like [Haliotis rubra]
MDVWVLVCLLSFSSLSHSADPPGHLQPIGSHAPPQTLEVKHEFPHPSDFFAKYVKPGIPVVFKSILENIDYKPYKTWTDEYLRERFGHTVVDVETGKKEDRNKELKSQTLRRFLDEYRKADVYLVHDLTADMKRDVDVPYCLRCGGFQKLFTKAITWFSSGGTKSVLHMDEFDNINCLLDGTKDLVFYDKKYGPDIEADGYVWDGSYSSVDVDSVDMYKFPRLSGLPWFKVHMEKGDCLFIPYRWYHQVNSFGSRNLAINIWLHHLHWFNATDCSVDVSWKTEGSLTKYGYGELHESFRDMVFAPLRMEESLTEVEFLERWREISTDKEASSKIFHHIDVNGDGELTWDELYTFNVDEMFKMYPKGFGNDFREEYRSKKDMMVSFLESRDQQGKDLTRDEL